MWTATPNRTIANNSAWGTGEFLLMRTNFEVKDLDHDCYRISILANQGYHIYLNGQKIHTFAYFEFYPKYNRIMLDKQHARHLKKGSNTLAVFSCVRLEQDPRPTNSIIPSGRWTSLSKGSGWRKSGWPDSSVMSHQTNFFSRSPNRTLAPHEHQP